MVQLAGLIQDRKCDRADVRMDALQVAQDVEVQGARVDALRAAGAQAREMVLRRVALGLADGHLLVDQSARDADVTGHEDPKRHLQIGEHPAVQRLDLRQPSSEKRS